MRATAPDEVELEIDSRYEGPPTTENSYNGYPYVGGVQHFKENDPEHLKPQANAVMHVKQFNTADAADLKEYTRIRQNAITGKVYIDYEEKQYNETIGGWHILISWGDLIFIEPGKKV